MPHASRDRKPRHHPHGAIIMSDSLSIATLLQAVERYFALMHDNDISRFDQVFASSAQLHGLRDTKLRLMSAQDYKAILASTASPKYRNAPRLEDPAYRFRIHDAGSCQSAGSYRCDSISRLPLVSPPRRRVAHHGKILSRRTKIRRSRAYMTTGGCERLTGTAMTNNFSAPSER